MPWNNHLSYDPIGILTRSQPGKLTKFNHPHLVLYQRLERVIPPEEWGVDYMPCFDCGAIAFDLMARESIEKTREKATQSAYGAILSASSGVCKEGCTLEIPPLALFRNLCNCAEVFSGDKKRKPILEGDPN